MINLNEDQNDLDQQALNQEAETENSASESPTEEQTTEEVQEVTEEAESTEEVETEAESAETGDSSKKGYSNRVRELNARAKQAEAEAESLRERLAQLTGSDEPRGYYNPQQLAQQFDEPLIQPGEEIDAGELDRRIKTRENRLLEIMEARNELRSRQTEAVNRINSEAQEVLKIYPELDPDNDSFNKELSDTVTEAVEAYVKNNPYSASVREFVGKLMKPYQRAITKEVGKAQETIAKQVSQAALRPTSVQSQEKSAADMSIDELEKKLGIVQG